MTTKILIIVEWFTFHTDSVNLKSALEFLRYLKDFGITQIIVYNSNLWLIKQVGCMSL